MSYSIINNSLKKSYLIKNLPYSKLGSAQQPFSTLNRVVLINNSTRNLNLNTSNLLLPSPSTSPILSSLSELKKQQPTLTTPNFLFQQQFLNKRFYSQFENDDFDKDQKNSFSEFNNANNANVEKENDHDNDDVKSTANTSNYVNTNDTSSHQTSDTTSHEQKEVPKDEFKAFYTKMRDTIVDKLNKIPSTLDRASTFKLDRDNLEKLSGASPYLLWTSFILASSMSACIFRQLTGSSIISNAVMIGIDFPAIVNVSHLYNQGGKMIARELGAEACPTSSELYEVVEAVSREIGLDTTPGVFIHPSEEINALTAGIKSDNTIILLTKGLLNNLKPEEIRAIVAHMLYHKKANFTGLGTHLTAMVSGFYAPYNFGRYIRNYLIECKKKKANSLLLDVAMGINSVFIFMTKLLNGFCYVSQSAFVRFRERQSLPKELMTDEWKSAIRKLYNQPASVVKESLINFNPAFTHLFLCDGKGEGWNKAANLAGNFDKDIQNGKIWHKKNVRTVTEYFSMFPSLKKRIEWTEVKTEESQQQPKEE